jgi:predicted DNA-binding protein (MmcQ/YjbR family)
MIDLESVREYCLRKKGKVIEDFPFGDDVLVVKVNGKIFVLIRMNVVPIRINLKCDPELAIELRERYAAVIPGYHMNKKYWNTVVLDGSIPPKEVYKMIDHSFDLVSRSA